MTEHTKISATPKGVGQAGGKRLKLSAQDGVLLTTDIYLPDGEGPFPSVVARSINDIKSMIRFAELYRKSGIAFVAQETRGHGTSEGEKIAHKHDGWVENKDGLSLLEWIRKQSWSNAIVGTWGPSNVTVLSQQLSGTDPKLSAQTFFVGSSDLYHRFVYYGGVPRFQSLESVGVVSSQETKTIWSRHTTYDQFWRDHNTLERDIAFRCPGLHVGGWWDIFSADAMIQSFLKAESHDSVDADTGNILILGPWAHNPTPGHTGDLTHGENTNFDLWMHWALEFHKKHLIKTVSEADGWSKVRYFTVGATGEPGAPGNIWRNAKAWPPFETSETAFYLNSDKKLVRKISEDSKFSFQHDPSNPVPTLGSFADAMASTPLNQVSLEERKDVLSFHSNVLNDPLETTGQIRVRLFVSTDAVDTDFMVKLLDIYPDGQSIQILDGAKRLKFRDGDIQVVQYKPGSVVPLEVNLGTISMIFNKGHRIGIHVQSSNFPRFAVNPGTGEDYLKDKGIPSSNSVFVGSENQSALLLQVPKRN